MLSPEVQVKSRSLKFALGFMIGGLAALARISLTPWLMNDFVFLTAYPSIVVAAFMGGNPAGIIATALGFLCPLLMQWISVHEGRSQLLLTVYACTGLLITGLVHYLHELRDRMDAQYQEILAHRTEFLARVSHELRTPLNVAMGRIQMLLSGKVPAEKHDDMLQVALRNLRLTQTLVNDLVEVSKSVSPRIDVVLRPLDLAALLQSVLSDNEPTARGRGVMFDSTIDGPLQVLGDSERLRQVFNNLLHNAVKFTPPPGTIWVRASAKDGLITVSVVDGGVGIDAADLPFIFEPFKQGGPAHYRDNTGLGLGLSIVKQLTEAHGGTVHAHSQGRGKGAAFILKFPQYAEVNGGIDAVLKISC
jgi:signal transduction histidine kinase